jgi:hypothetical protein
MIGIYHEKVGILTDAEGDRLTFSGSSNENVGMGCWDIPAISSA